MVKYRVVGKWLIVAAICGVAPNYILYAGEAAAPSAESVKMDIDWLDVRGINQPLTPDQTAVQVTYRLNGKEVSDAILVDADTYIAKGVDRNKGGEAALVLRDNAFCQALLRVNLTSLPKDADIVSASLRIKLQGVERKGETGSFFCRRILTPWTEDATWFKPQPSAANWDGLKAGRDIENPPFASLENVALDEPKSGGKTLGIPNFAGILRQWQSGAVPNNGFLLSFNSKAVQVVIASRRSAAQSRSLSLGGATNGEVLFVPNFPQLDRLLLRPSDLLSAQPSLSLSIPAKGNLSAGKLNLYESDSTTGARGKLLASVPSKDLQSGSFQLPELIATFKGWLASGTAKPALLMTLENPDSAPAPEMAVAGIRNPHRPTLTVKILNYPSYQLFGKPPVTPEPGVYSKIENGHIAYGGKRLRLWGVIGYPHPDRLLKMGFNAQRIWAPTDNQCYSPESAMRGTFAPYQKGDGSKFDLADKHFAEVKTSGLFVMFAALTNTIPADLVVHDGSFVAGGEDWEAWKDAMQTKGLPLQHVIFVDERLQKIRKAHARNLLTHVNPYTGKAYGEEECIALYEVFNENAFVDKILNGELDKWPPYFKAKLQDKWNEWLRKRYSDDAGLSKSWGVVAKGESLANRSVQLAPDFGFRVRYPEKRASDYVEFMVDLENRFNQDFREYCRSLFPNGVGVNVAPFSFDTQYRPNTPWAYTESLGDVSCNGMYFWNSDSTLSKPPSAYVMDSFTTAGMPTVIYETNAGRPCPYRSEYPIKVAAMASREDWDGVFWHYWSQGGGENDIEYLAGTFGYPNPVHYWTAVYNELDPVMCSAMAMGGQLFLRQKLPPAEDPVVFKVGRKALFSYDTFRGINTAAATFTKGSRIDYDPKDDSGITVNGKEMPLVGRMAKALAGGEDVTWDWPNERLIIDAPTVKCYVGKIGNNRFCFKDGIALSNVNAPWICFTMTSADGKPLSGPDASRRILMSGVFDAKNNGFLFDYKTQGGPLEQSKGIFNLGHEPIVVDKVEYQVSFANALDGILKSYDFALREVKDTPISGSNQLRQQGATPFMDVLEVKQWGSTSPGFHDEPTEIETAKYADLILDPGHGGGISASAQSGAVYPIDGLLWGMDYRAVHKLLRDSPLIYTSISNEDTSGTGEKTIALTDATLPLLGTA